MSSDVIRSHLRNGEWELAVRGAEAALKSAPEAERGVLYALLSRSLNRLGRVRDAMSVAEEGARHSDHWEVTLALGEALIAVGEPLAAQALLQEALRVAREASAPRSPALSDVSGPPMDPNAISASADEESPWSSAEVNLGAALAEACRAAGDPRTGLGVGRRAVILAERTTGPTSLQTAEALHALGVCLLSSGENDEAKEALERALKIRRDDNPDHSDVASTLDALGKVSRARGHPFAAVRLHREALELWKLRVGPRSGPVGSCLHALGQALHRTGDFVAAREEMRKAHEITRKNLGVDHVDTWISRFELGRFELDCGEFQIGLKMMAEARTEVAERLGSDHPVVKSMDHFL